MCQGDEGDTNLRIHPAESPVSDHGAGTNDTNIDEILNQVQDDNVSLSVIPAPQQSAGQAPAGIQDKSRNSNPESRTNTEVQIPNDDEDDETTRSFAPLRMTTS